jgi:hypothetical protein
MTISFTVLPPVPVPSLRYVSAPIPVGVLPVPAGRHTRVRPQPAGDGNKKLHMHIADRGSFSHLSLHPNDQRADTFRADKIPRHAGSYDTWDLELLSLSTSGALVDEKPVPDIPINANGEWL